MTQTTTVAAPVDRRKFVGGSDIAGIMGIAPPGWRTALDIWRAKTLPDAAVEPETPTQVRKRLARGTIVEPLVATLLAHLHGLPGIEVRNRRYSTGDFGCEIDAEIAFGLVDKLFDGRPLPLLIDGDDPADETVNVEIKTVHPFAAREWGDDGSDEVPVHYAAQVQWGLGVTGRRFALCAALFGADDLRLYPIVRDDAIIDALLAGAAAFWQCVVAGEAPAPQTIDDALSLWPTAKPAIAEATPEIAAAVSTLRMLKDIAKGIDPVALTIRRFMKDADTLTVDGEVVATCKNRATTSINTELLAEKFPDAEKATRRRGSTRALLLKD